MALKIKLDKDGWWEKRLKRQFLAEDINSYCVTGLEINKQEYGKHNVYISGSLELSDCGSNVYLSFHPKKDAKKLQKLIDQLLEFQEALAEAQEFADNLPIKETEDES